MIVCSWRTALVQSELGACLLSQGQTKYAEAETLLVNSYGILQAALGSQDRRTREAVMRIIQLYHAWGKPDASAKYRALLPVSEPSSGMEPGLSKSTGGQGVK